MPKDNNTSVQNLISLNQQSHLYLTNANQNPQIKINQVEGTHSNNELLHTDLINKRFFINTPTTLNDNPSNDIVGIDGTGGQPKNDIGIDGTGGQPNDDTGIDGTGGQPKDIADDEKEITKEPCRGSECPEPPPECEPTKECHAPPQAIVPSVSVKGTLQRFGNYLRVNGRNFRVTDTTKITVNGQKDADITKLTKGQVVTVIGGTDKDNKLIAQEVVYHTSVSGKISHLEQYSVTVLGQTIVFHKDIIFAGTATQLSDLTIGDTINVSGFRLSDGKLSATRIERVENQTNRLTGVITGLNESEKTFEVNNLTINYEETPITDVLENGQTVHLKGKVNPQDSFVFNANTVDIAESVLDTPADKVEIEGFITQFSNTSKFSMGNIQISTNSQTQFIGNEQNDLKLNTKIEVEGYINSNNILIAQNVLFLVANLEDYTEQTKGANKLSSSTATFTWNDVGAEKYHLQIVYSGGDGDFYNQILDSNTTSVKLSGLPETSAHFEVYLRTLQDGFWSQKKYRFIGVGTVRDTKLTSHKRGDSLTGATATFTWTKTLGADAYRLRIFDYVGGIDYFSQTFTTPQAVTVNNLPTNGADLNVSLETLYNGWWSSNIYDLKSVGLVENATLTSHSNGQRLSSSSETFTWKDVGAEQYEIIVARNEINGWLNILESIQVDGSTTSITIDNLPINSGEVLIRLRTKHTGWATQKYTLIGSGLIPEAELTSHSDNDTLSSNTQTFTWEKIPEAEKYQLTLRNMNIDMSSVFSEDYDSLFSKEAYDISTIVQTINNLPNNGADISLTLSTRHNGYWAHKDYRLKGASGLATAKITSHAGHAPIINTSPATITWEDVNADAYSVKVMDFSNTLFPVLHEQTYGTDTHSVVLNDLPNNKSLWIRVSTKHGQWWGSHTITAGTAIKNQDKKETTPINNEVPITTKTSTIGILQQRGDYLIVNRKKFKVTEQTQAFSDGKNINTSSLKSGQIVMVNGDIDEKNYGIAKEVIHTTTASGTITHLKDNIATVLGQTIILNNYMTFGGTATQLADIKLGDSISVSGFILSNGNLSATRVDRLNNASDINKVSGTIYQLNEANQTFSINQLTINYNQVTDMPLIENGMKIHVAGHINNSSILNANSIIVTKPVTDHHSEKIALEGFITDVIDASNFSIGNIQISTSLQTQFIGKDKNSLEKNTKIEVEGQLGSDNILIAEKIIFLVSELKGYKTYPTTYKLSSSTVTFEWDDVDATAYRLRIAYADKGNFYHQILDGNTTSVTLSGLAENSAGFFVYLQTLQGEFWSQKAYHFSGVGTAPEAELTSPQHGDILDNSSATFTWSKALGAEAYRLRIYDIYTNNDYFNQVFTDSEAITIDNLPTNGADLYISLETLHNGWWSSKTYKVKSVQLLKNAELTSHIDRQQLSSTNETFTWEDVGAEQYELRIAKRRVNGWYNHIETILLDGSETSATVYNLPINSSEVLVNLRTKHVVEGVDLKSNTIWATNRYTFTGSGSVDAAELNTHADKEVLPSSTQTFGWATVPAAQQYHLTIRNTHVDPELVFSDTYNPSTTAATIDNLPKNSAKVLLTLSTQQNEYWEHKTYLLQGTDELADAKITSHDNIVINTSSTTIRWDNVNADAYLLKVSDSTNGGKIYEQELSADTTSVVLDNLPKNSWLWVSLSTKHGNWWGNHSMSLITKIP